MQHPSQTWQGAKGFPTTVSGSTRGTTTGYGTCAERVRVVLKSRTRMTGEGHLMRKLTALTVALTVLATAGCSVDTRQATNLTNSSATLNAVVRCDANSRGTAWWEIRKSGGAWRLAASHGSFVCPATTHALEVSKNVDGLRAGVPVPLPLGGGSGPAGGPLGLLQPRLVCH